MEIVHNTKSLYLSIDQGGHASRAIVFNFEGEPVATASYDIQTLHPQKDYVEHDAKALLESVRSAVNDVIASLGDRARYIEAAGLATQRSNIVCWDSQTGEALSPIISWQDTRANEWLESQKLDREDIHKTTGLFPSAHYGASKLRWCLDNLEPVKQALKDKRLACGPMSSYLSFHLVKERSFLVDPVNASRTLLWHIHRKNWDGFLLEQFGIPEDVLPTCVPTCSDFGRLDIDSDANIPLTVVTGDQSAAMFAYGQLQYETAYINMGTGAFISRPSGYAMIYARRMLTSIIYSNRDDSQYVLEGTVNGAGSAIEWLQQQQPVDDLWNKLPQWLKQYSNPPLFLNGISGLAAPYWIPGFQTDFDKEKSTEENYVAVLESIIFLIHANVQEMMKFASTPQQIQITGGLSQLDGLCQRISDLTRLPIYRPKECEATARGTAYLVAGMPERWPEQQHGDWFKPEDNAVIDGRFLLWEQAMLQRMRDEDHDV